MKLCHAEDRSNKGTHHEIKKLDKDSYAGNNTGKAAAIDHRSFKLDLINGEPGIFYGSSTDARDGGVSTSLTNEMSECGRVYDFFIFYYCTLPSWSISFVLDSPVKKWLFLDGMP